MGAVSLSAPDGGDGPPEEVVVLEVPANYIGVELGGTQPREQGRSVQQ
jgi:hypothetical protein